MRRRHPTVHLPSSGSVLVITLLLVLALGSLAGMLSFVNARLHGEHERAREDLRAFYAAEAGLEEARAVLLAGGLAAAGALEYPRVVGAGSFGVELLDGRDDRSVDLDRVRLRSVGSSGRDAAGVQLMLHHVPTGAFEFALFGAEGVHLDSNVSVDSYDPDDGPYPDKVDFVNDFGNVGSYAALEIDANVSIHGDALVGRDGVFDDGAPGILVTGDQEARELDVEMPEVTVPALKSLGALAVSAAKTLGPGELHYSALTVSGATLTIRGPATLVLDDFVMRSKARLVVDAAGGPVTIFATGDVELASNTKIQTSTQRASDLSLVITTDTKGGKVVDLSSNTRFQGTIYAPNAHLRVPSNFEVFGAIKARSVELASNSRVHFDEQLLYDPDAPDVFEPVSWRPLSREEVRALAVLGGPQP